MPIYSNASALEKTFCYISEGSEILTYGKTYEVEQNPIMTMTYDIIGDNNIGVSVIKHSFITIESFREMKLNSLLE